MLKAIGSKVDLSCENERSHEFLSFVSDLIDNEEVCRMKEYLHHGVTTTYQHCLNVAYYNYLLCKLLSLDARSAARGGMLHDMFLYDWHTYRCPRGRLPHPFTHGTDALTNAEQHFELNPIERDVIEKHMFPLITSFPHYRETMVIILVDKYCGLIETVSGWAQKAWATFSTARETLRDAKS